MPDALLIVLAYVLGSMPSAVWISKLFRLQDPRKFGSGNPGATNMLRTNNKLAAALTLILDIGKGVLAVMFARWWATYNPETTIAMAAVAVVIGHVWPIFLGFRGGKGVATSGGALLAIHPWVGIGVIAVWILAAALFRYSSLASILAAISASIWGTAFKSSSVSLAATTVLAIIVIFRSKDNLLRLWNGTEPKLGQKRETPPPASHQ